MAAQPTVVLLMGVLGCCTVTLAAHTTAAGAGVPGGVAATELGGSVELDTEMAAL